MPMPTLFKSAVLGVALAVSATTASADNHDHEVYIYSHGYFPSTLYLGSGDRVRFINRFWNTMWVQVEGGANVTSNISAGNYMDVVITGTDDITLDPPRLASGGYYSSAENGYLRFGSAPRQ